MHRFYVPQPLDTDLIELSGDEAAHMLRVLRLTVGDAVSLFDGEGSEAVAEITGTQKRTVRLRIREVRPRDQPVLPMLTLATAVPKSDRFRWLVEKATELGVKRLIPMCTERSVVHPGEGKIDKMQSAVIAACKQSGRNDLLVIDPMKDWTDVLRETIHLPKLIAQPGGKSLRSVLPSVATDAHIVLMIGPEGGFTAGEIELARSAGGKIVGLTNTILRMETAAVSMVASIRLCSARSKPDS